MRYNTEVMKIKNNMFYRGFVCGVVLTAILIFSVILVDNEAECYNVNPMMEHKMSSFYDRDLSCRERGYYTFWCENYKHDNNSTIECFT